jgi:hypothetical protein
MKLRGRKAPLFLSAILIPVRPYLPVCDRLCDFKMVLSRRRQWP